MIRLGLTAALAATAVLGQGQADEYRDWLNGKITEPRTAPPLFSSEQWSRLPETQSFDYGLVESNGIPTPMVNGEPLLGVSYRYCAFSLEQAEYDSRILAAAGVNILRSSVRSIAGEGGKPAAIDLWREKNAPFHRHGVGVMLDSVFGRAYIEDGLQDLYANVLGKDLPAAFVRGMRHPVGRRGRYGDFFDAEYRRAHGQVLAELLRALGPQSVVGFIYSDEPGLRWSASPPTEAAAEDFRRFLKRFYQDGTPDVDSNRDGATFNGAFGKSWHAWEEVQPFSEDEYRALGHVRGLVDVWMRTGHAQLMDTLSAECQRVLPTASVSEAYIGGQLVSLLNAMPHTKYVGFGNYDRVVRTALYTGMAHAYGKPSYTFHINRGRSDYRGARHIGVASLPFTAGQIWWHLTVGANDAAEADYGRHYSLANWWEHNDLRPANWDGATLNRLVEYDPRFLIIPQIRPFLGRFDSVPQELANGVLWIDPPCEDLVRNTHCVTEEALVLGEQELDLNRYRLVIFLSRRPAMFLETHARLREYVRRGGTALVNVNELGSGRTLFGQENARAWLNAYRPGRANRTPQAEALIYEDTFVDCTRWQADRFAHEGPCSLVSKHTRNGVGAYPYGASGGFTYRFAVPEEFAYFRIADVHTVWGETNDVKMWLSADNATWKLVHDDVPQDVSAYRFSRVFSAADELGPHRDVFIKYRFYAGNVKRQPEDNRGASLRYFRIEGLSGEDAGSLAEWAGEHGSTVTFGGGKHSFDSLEPYVLPAEGMAPHGTVTDTKGAERPFIIVVPEGKGRWIAWNSPESIITLQHGARGFDRNVFAAKWDLLDRVVRTHTEGLIEDYREPYIAQGDGCLMAATWYGGTARREHPISFASSWPQTVCYEVLDEVCEGGRHIETETGTGSFTKDLSAGARVAHLWVLKPYGRPIVLCCDGTVKHRMRIDDGTLRRRPGGGRELRFTMARKAAVSSPTPPRAARHHGKEAEWAYDERSATARITGTGDLGECVLTF